MIYKRLPTGMYSSNCYILGDHGEGILIDPGADRSEILEAVEKTGLKIRYILLTHAHIDHICTVDSIREDLGAQVLVHEADAAAITDAWQNGSALFGLSKTFRKADRTVADGEVLEVGGLKVDIIHTPGHTPGGICIKVGESLFTGDTLFRMSVGRTDLGNGDYDQLMDSIKNKLMKLDDETVVYPGHGTSSTIGYERKHNPFL